MTPRLPQHLSHYYFAVSNFAMASLWRPDAGRGRAAINAGAAGTSGSIIMALWKPLKRALMR